MEKRFLIACLAILSTTGMWAKSSFIVNENGDTIEQIINDYEHNIDSLLVDWRYSAVWDDTLNIDETILDQSFKDIPDSVFIQRLQQLSIESGIELPYNDQVRSFIETYAVKRRAFTSALLGLSEYYFPMFEAILDRNNMPLELKYLPIIESALNPRAYSRAGASGLWQFVYATGKMYNLNVSTFVDDRRDPVKSSIAAANYLKDLYKIHNDWLLVIAAYNCGPGNVNKAIKRTSDKRDYWAIYYRLPRETRGYVPAFIAANYIMSYYREHGIVPTHPEITLVTDTVDIKTYVHFNKIADVLDVSLEKIRELNPQYCRDVIPGSPEKPYSLRLPTEKLLAFLGEENEIYGYQTDKYFGSRRSVANPEVLSKSSMVAPKNLTPVTYKVKTGDNIGYIAWWFDVRSTDIKYWNNLRNNNIRAGQKLTIFVPESRAAFCKTIDAMSFAEKQAMDGADKGSNKITTPSATSSVVSDDKYEYYTLKSGESLWDVAQKYPGISSTDILRLNNIKDARKLQAGQQLKIKLKDS